MATASSTSRSPGDAGLGAAAIRRLAAEHGLHPAKALGQHFLIDPNLARWIAEAAGVGPGDRVLEIGAGLGSLTLPLAVTGAEVVAVELDRAAVAALEEVVAGRPGVRVLHADAMSLAWTEVLGPGDDPWVLCANLPYNIATPLVLDVLEDVPRIRRLVVMVQREVAERLAARPGDAGFGAVSLHVAYAAEATVLRRVGPTVFWPRPGVGSAIVRIERRVAPPVDVDPERLWRVVDEAFGQRRKTMRNAVRRLGLDAGAADAALAACGVAVSARPEELGLEAFARVAAAVPA